MALCSFSPYQGCSGLVLAHFTIPAPIAEGGREYTRSRHQSQKGRENIPTSRAGIVCARRSPLSLFEVTRWRAARLAGSTAYLRSLRMLTYGHSGCLLTVTLDRWRGVRGRTRHGHVTSVKNWREN
eukprot:1180249-Prorocentrum_minimum.AAC.3